MRSPLDLAGKMEQFNAFAQIRLSRFRRLHRRLGIVAGQVALWAKDLQKQNAVMFEKMKAEAQAQLDKPNLSPDMRKMYESHTASSQQALDEMNKPKSAGQMNQADLELVKKYKDQIEQAQKEIPSNQVSPRDRLIAASRRKIWQRDLPTRTIEMRSSKMNPIRILVIATLLFWGALPAKAQEVDAQGSKDHPLISRYPGSLIDEYSQKEFDEYDLPLSKFADGKYEKTQRIEGKVTAIYYKTPEGRSALEIFRNYDSALKSGGFQTLFTCAKTCGDAPPRSFCPLNDSFGNYSVETRYLSAKLVRAAGDVYVALWVYDTSFDIKTFLTIIELKPLESGLVTVNAASLASDITRAGHASVYGIYFDTGKADVKPDSDSTLKEISKLLQQDARLKLYVVGHTDNVGSLASNMDLSKRRGDAVVTVLTTKYNIAAARLSAQGDGPTAPVASNDSEEGRAKNRRVELVKQ